MTRRQSLRQALARRWMAFAAALSLLFAGATLLLLFVLEDSFIDRRLRAVAASPAVAQGATAALPAQGRLGGWPQLADVTGVVGATGKGAHHPPGILCR